MTTMPRRAAELEASGDPLGGRRFAGTLVPKDHFYRHLEVKRDSSFVRKRGRGPDADRDRPSADSVISGTMQLEMFLAAIRSECGAESARG